MQADQGSEPGACKIRGLPRMAAGACIGQRYSPIMATLSIRVDLDPAGRLGPGKVLLLETIAEHGSISAAGRALHMSYRRAWELVADLNASFDQPLVEAQPGGKSGGGARLTARGRELVAHYRAIETKAAKAVTRHLQALDQVAGKGAKPLPKPPSPRTAKN
jgi:molybdate transport system regulatory protein